MTIYLHKYLDDFYHLKISQKDIMERENISRNDLRKDIKNAGILTPQQWRGKINTGIKELDKKLNEIYSGIATRCNGNTNDKYKLKVYDGLDYLSIIEWVEFCNNRKDKLLTIWRNYLDNNKEAKYMISIDRIDSDKGYILDNIQFVSFGFNSWKRNINPLRVCKENGEWKYFMSGEEGSKYYNLRRQSIGDLLRGQYREISNAYKVEKSTVKEVLLQNNISTLEDYYNKISNDNLGGIYEDI